MSRLPFGTVYLIEQGRTHHEIIRDFQNIRDMGFDLITLWPVANSWLAERPDEFVFDDTRRVLDMCLERGMKAIMQLIGQNPSQEYMPDSLFNPDMQVQDAANWSWANPNHPEVDRHIRRYIHVAVSALKDHPAVYGWDVFNEAHIHEEDPWMTEAFRKWLKKRYQSIENLNRHWYRRYSNFDQVRPADLKTVYSIWSSLLTSVEYDRFRSERLTEICREWVGYVRECDSDHPVMIDCVAGNMLGGDITLTSNDDFGIAGTGDIFGGTFYPKSWNHNLTQGWELPLRYVLSMSAAIKAGKPFFVAELQTHTQSALTPGSEVENWELSAWIWSGLASGAKGIQLWRWRPFLRGFQATGRGLTAIDGTPGPRAQAVNALTKVIRKNEELFAEAQPIKPAVKIVISYHSRLFHDALRFGLPGGEYPAEIEGWFRVFWSSGILVEFIDINYLDDDDLNTPVLVLPSLVSCSDKTCQKLEAYVRNGGLLMADARLSVINEYGVVRVEGPPGEKLSRALGVKEIDVGGPVQFDFLGEKIMGGFLSQKLDCVEAATVIGCSIEGNPIAVEHSYGRGHSLYFGAFVGQNWKTSLTNKQQTYFRNLILKAAPKTPWAEKTDNVNVTFHRSADRYLVYMINTGNMDEEVNLHNVPATKDVLDLITSTEIPGGEIVMVTVPAKKARVLTWSTAK